MGWNDPTGGGNNLVALPFPFDFYGEPKTEININGEGWTSFTDSWSGCSSLFSIPNGYCSPACPTIIASSYSSS